MARKYSGTRYLIYGLIDPRSLLIRYVGKSSSGLHRPKAHVYDRGHRHSVYWISQLSRLGLRYEIVVLEHCTREMLNSRERWWIAYGRLSQWPLTNHTDGGDGAGHPHTPESKRKIGDAHRGRKHTAATRRMLSAIAKADGRGHYVRGAETRRKVSESNRRRVISKETRQKMSRSAKKRVARDGGLWGIHKPPS